jgi:hypothetical protein
MVEICPQQGCTAVHHLSANDLGQPFTCRKCGATLVFTPQGLKLAAAVGQPPTVVPVISDVSRDDPRPAPDASTPSQPRSSMTPEPPAPRAADIVFMIMFAAGAFLVIVFLFCPILDQLRIRSKQADIDAGDRKVGIDRFKKDLPFGDDKDKPKDKQDERESWEKKKKTLKENMDDAETQAIQSHYYYTWGMLVGFLLLAMSSVGFLSRSQTTAHKVLGTIVLAAVVLLVFFMYLISSTFLRYR